MIINYINKPISRSDAIKYCYLQLAAVRKDPKHESFRVVLRLKGAKGKTLGQFIYRNDSVEKRIMESYDKAVERLQEHLTKLDTNDGETLFVHIPTMEQARAGMLERATKPINEKRKGEHKRQNEFRSNVYEAMTHKGRLRAVMKHIYSDGGLSELQAIVASVNELYLDFEQQYRDENKEREKKLKAAAHLLEMMQETGLTVDDLAHPQAKQLLKIRTADKNAPKQYQCFHNGQFINYSTADGDTPPPPMQDYLNKTNQKLCDIRV